MQVNQSQPVNQYEPYTPIYPDLFRDKDPKFGDQVLEAACTLSKNDTQAKTRLQDLWLCFRRAANAFASQDRQGREKELKSNTYSGPRTYIWMPEYYYLSPRGNTYVTNNYYGTNITNIGSGSVGSTRLAKSISGSGSSKSKETQQEKDAKAKLWIAIGAIALVCSTLFAAYFAVTKWVMPARETERKALLAQRQALEDRTFLGHVQLQVEGQEWRPQFNIVSERLVALSDRELKSRQQETTAWSCFSIAAVGAVHVTISAIAALILQAYVTAASTPGILFAYSLFTLSCEPIIVVALAAIAVVGAYKYARAHWDKKINDTEDRDAGKNALITIDTMLLNWWKSEKDSGKQPPATKSASSQPSSQPRTQPTSQLRTQQPSKQVQFERPLPYNPNASDAPPSYDESQASVQGQAAVPSAPNLPT